MGTTASLARRRARWSASPRRVSATTYRTAVEALGERGVVDLVGILGYYVLISMTINAFEVPLPDGAADPFPE